MTSIDHTAASTTSPPLTAHSKPALTPKYVHDTLQQYQVVGNVKGALALLKKAQAQHIATAEMYTQTIDLLLNSPMDVDASSLVAAWFYHPQSTVPEAIRQDLNVWKAVLKLGFRLGGTFRKDDLNSLLETFVTTFDLSTLKDQTCWELLIRGYGIMQNKDTVANFFSRLMSEPQFEKLRQHSLRHNATLAYAAIGAHDQVDALVAELDTMGNVNETLLQQLIRVYGFSGNLTETNKYLALCEQKFPDANNDTMALVAHKSALAQHYRHLAKTRGAQGLPLKPHSTPEIDQLHASWREWIDKASARAPLDITQCNVMLEYLTLANRIDPKRFPIAMAEQLVDETMPKHSIQPNDMTWMTLLLGYARSHDFASSSDRLDATLQVLARMQQAGHHTADQACFHALFKACLPHVPSKGFVFDYFHQSSDLATVMHHRSTKRPALDKRLLELESIMLDARIPHDRTSIQLMLTALGCTGKYKAMWKRWDLLKASGVRRDMGLYQHIFALASMDAQQAQFALSVTRSELDREVRGQHHLIPWSVHVAMLDCAVAAHDAPMASAVVQEMRRHHVGNDCTDSDKYVPILRAYTSLPSLAAQLPPLLDEIKQKQLPYHPMLWQYTMSYHLLHDDSGASTSQLQQTFNSYTMQRFQHLGRIPIPVRDEPVVPFPSAPYSAGDMAMINMYVAGLLDAQDLSLVFDVLKTLAEETNTLGLSRVTAGHIVKLAKQQRSPADMAWLAHHILPRVPSQTNYYRKWVQHLQSQYPL
ncbi:hypothetical protein BC940DRAFT_241381 [Gongronella butleri]|nr:hypothetical protein BC940DRAFT_241381 [Gongronella butleri]